MAGSAVSEPAFLAAYRGCFERTWADETPVERVRFVVLDSETTGLDPRTDRIITIGAVAVQDGEILIADSFSRCSRWIATRRRSPSMASPAIKASTACPSREAMERFLDYVKDGVIVGHHIGHDIATFDAACQRHWGATLLNRSLDTMDLTLHLERDGAFAGRPPIRALHPRRAVRDVRRRFRTIATRRPAMPSSPRRCFCGWCAWPRREAGAPLGGICEPFQVAEEA